MMKWLLDYFAWRCWISYWLHQSSSTIPTTVQDAVTDLGKLKHVDWCTLVYEKLKTGVTDWKNKSSKTRNLMGCIYLLLVSILLYLLVLCREPII